MTEATASDQIDAIIQKTSGWRGERLAQLRALIRDADPGLREEVKWKKPSRPEGVAVWSHDGIVCVGEALKNAVRLTFPKGAELSDPKRLFNTRLNSKTVRAIDFHEDDALNEPRAQGTGSRRRPSQRVALAGQQRVAYFRICTTASRSRWADSWAECDQSAAAGATDQPKLWDISRMSFGTLQPN